MVTWRWYLESVRGPGICHSARLVGFWLSEIFGNHTHGVKDQTWYAQYRGFFRTCVYYEHALNIFNEPPGSTAKHADVNRGFRKQSIFNGLCDKFLRLRVVEGIHMSCDSPASVSDDLMQWYSRFFCWPLWLVMWIADANLTTTIHVCPVDLEHWLIPHSEIHPTLLISLCKQKYRHWTSQDFLEDMHNTLGYGPDFEESWTGGTYFDVARTVPCTRRMRDFEFDVERYSEREFS